MQPISREILTGYKGEGYFRNVNIINMLSNKRILLYRNRKEKIITIF